MKHEAHITAPTATAAQHNPLSLSQVQNLASEIADRMEAERILYQASPSYAQARLDMARASLSIHQNDDPDRMPLDPSAQPSSSNLEFYQRRNS